MVNNLIVCGGTFDHFHKGHESLLKLAFSLGNKVVIGVTSDSFVKSDKRKATSEKQIEPFGKRKKAVLEFIKKEKVLNKTRIIKINDLFGPTLSREFPIDAIVVSDDTKKGAEIINQKRQELDLKPLEVFVAPIIAAQDGKFISSARIRNGQISRTGKLYIKSSWFKTDLILPANLRQELKKPFGELLTRDKDLFKNKNNLVITVGDVTTKKFNERSLEQNLSVIDFKVAREKKFTNIKELGFAGQEIIFNVDNPAGFITSSLSKKLAEIFALGIKKKTVLQINGEEDLAVLPLILAVPLNTIIYYGQPDKGLVKVLVSEKSKEIAYGLVDRFEIKY